MTDPADDLWPHFVPLWTDLRGIAPGVMLAGGYGLFLKQKWLLSQVASLLNEDGSVLLTQTGGRLILEGGVPTLVEVHRWGDQTPRVTNDLDILVELDLIASRDEQQRLDAALARHDFHVVEKNARWQFEKRVDDAHHVIVDFHAPPPLETRDDVRVQSRRVRPKPSLAKGIHGRENPEALGCELHPFSFVMDGVEIVLPNPVTLAFMKLVAMRDRRLASEDDTKSAGVRNFEEAQAQKHARDVCRVMAMMTRDENDRASQILEATRATSVFAVAAETFGTYFGNDEAWGTRNVADMWRSEDLQLIQRTLATWFQ